MSDPTPSEIRQQDERRSFRTAERAEKRKRAIALDAEGLSVTLIAQRLKCDRKTIMKWLEP
jgi:transposase